MNISLSTIKKHVILIGSGIILIFVLTSALVAYATPWLDPISKSFKRLYPAAVIGTSPISIVDADEAVALGRRLDSSANRQHIFNHHLDNARAEVLLRNFGLRFNSDDVSDELNFYKVSHSDYQQFLNQYFNGNERLFEDSVVLPQVVGSKLRVHYNSDFNLNKEAYDQAQNILARIKAGEKFEDLAKLHSDDRETAQFGGDLGFFEHGGILPELEEEIVIRKTGEVPDIIVTRNGYEIALLVEASVIEGKKMWRAKHILVETTGFEIWLKNQINTIPVKILKKY